MRKIALALVALATAAAIAPNAVAGTISFTTTVPSTLTDFTANPAVSQFNTALGTLEDVIITFSGSGGTVVTATNNSSSSTSKLTQVSTDLFYTLADDTIPAVDDEGELAGTFGSGNPSSPIVTLSKFPLPGDSYTSGSLALSNVGGPGVQELTSGLSPFEGNGNVTFDLTTQTQSGELYTNGNVTTTQVTNAGGVVTVEYDYITATPEPSSLFLLGTGLLGLAAVVMARKGKPAKNLVLKP